MNRTFILAGAASAALMLGACGGGGGGAEPMPPTASEPTEVPESATVSPAAFVTFTGSLPASDTKEPLDITKAMPPTSDTDEPMPIT